MPRTLRGFPHFLMDLSPPTESFWYTARFKMKMNMSSHPRKPSMAFLIPRLKSLFSVTPITRAASHIRIAISRCCRFVRALRNLFPRCASNSRADISSTPARSASRATVTPAQALPSPTLCVRPLNSGGCHTIVLPSRNECALLAFPNPSFSASSLAAEHGPLSMPTFYSPHLFSYLLDAPPHSGQHHSPSAF